VKGKNIHSRDISSIRLSRICRSRTCAHSRITQNFLIWVTIKGLLNSLLGGYVTDLKLHLRRWTVTELSLKSVFMRSEFQKVVNWSCHQPGEATLLINPLSEEMLVRTIKTTRMPSLLRMSSTLATRLPSQKSLLSHIMTRSPFKMLWVREHVVCHQH